MVRDSSGHEDERHVIESMLQLGKRTWRIELTLTSREDMMFRMLLGRSAIIDGELTINPAASYVTGQALSKIYPSHH